MNDSSILFAYPNFLTGMASTLDIGATLTIYNESKNPEEADLKALKNDWLLVCNDINNALKEWEFINVK